MDQKDRFYSPPFIFFNPFQRAALSRGEAFIRSPEPAALRTLGASAQRTTMEYCSASDLACWTALCCLVSSYPGSTASQFAQPASICITGAIAGHVASSGTVCPPPCPRRRPLILALAIQKDAASATDGPWTACYRAMGRVAVLPAGLARLRFRNCRYEAGCALVPISVLTCVSYLTQNNDPRVRNRYVAI